MIGVISLLGMQSLQDALAGRLEKSGIQFLCKDCLNDVALIRELEQRTYETDIVLLNNGILQMANLERILADVRRLSQSVRIVMILGGMRKQYISAQLDEYKNSYMVSDIIFEGNGVNLEELASIIVKGRMTEHEILIQSEVAVEYENIQKVKSTNTIAVFGVTHGTGVTSMAVSLAEYFSLYGKMIKVVDLTGTASLAFAKGKAIYLTQKRQDLKEIKATSDFVIYDFGVPFHITTQGDFQGLANDYQPDLIYEMKRCSLKVCMGFLASWHIKKAEYFWNDEKWKRIIENDYVFLFDDDPAGLKNKYKNINIFERNDEAFADIVGKLFMNRE